MKNERGVLIAGKKSEESGEWLRELFDGAEYTTKEVTTLESALDAVPGEEFDVTIVDRDVMDDVEVLGYMAAVQSRAPQTARIVIQRSEEIASTAGLPIQATLTSASALEEAKQVIERAIAVRRATATPEISALLGDVSNLPVAPATYSNLTKLRRSKNATMKDFAAVIEQDPAVAVEVLKMANTAFFGQARRVDSVLAATLRLGLDFVNGLALAVQTMESVGQKTPRGFSTTRFQKYSLHTGLLAKAFSPSPELADLIFSSGLLLDVGQLIIATHQPEKFAQVNKLVADGKGIEEAELEVLGATRGQLGAVLLDRWDLPLDIVECALFHANPSRQQHCRSSVLAATHAAWAMLGVELCGDPESNTQIDFLEQCGMAENLEGMRAKAKKAAEVFSET